MTPFTVSPYTVEQRAAALERANSARLDCSRVKTRISQLPRTESRALAVSLLEDPSEAMMRLKVWDLLMAIRGAGEVHVRFWLGRAGLFPQKRVRELTVRQRLELAGILRDWS